MNFTTPIFFYFFLIVFILRWLVPFFFRNPDKAVLWLLLFASYLFYMSWDYRFASLLFLVSASDFYLGKKIHATGRKIYLISALLIDLGILSFFKYSNFFIENLLLLTGVTGGQLLSEIVLPLGISFYIFQSLAYVIDVYRKEIIPEQSFFKYALFLSFFPQLVAGPVVSARILLPQFDSLKTFAGIRLNRALFYLVSGFIKKSVIADHISVYSDAIFSAPGAYSATALVVGVLSYSIQIYCDFSGYTDMAIGLGHLLGFDLPENFNMPYLASSLSDFWRRWHITLSGWLKTYLYFSLGGNRVSGLLTYRNLFVTMLLGGLWHGASWNFVIWGGMHGILLGIERLVADSWKFRPGPMLRLPLRIFSGIRTFVAVSLLWVFFRSTSYSDAVTILQRMFTLQDGAGPGSLAVFGYVLAVMAAAHIYGSLKKEKIESLFWGRPGMREILAAGVITIFSVLISSDAKPFIYFVF